MTWSWKRSANQPPGDARSGVRAEWGLVEASATLQRLGHALTSEGFEIESAAICGHEALVGRRSDFRWKWFATRLHTFVVAFTVADVREGVAAELTAGAQQYSIDEKEGLPRGLLTVGRVYLGHLRRIVEAVIAPAVGTRSELR
jgi:hypothetical protein